MKKQKYLALFLSAAMITASLAGCGGGGDSGGSSKSKFNDGYGENVIRLALDGEIETADVQLTTADYHVPQNLYDTLLEVKSHDDGTSELVGSLAESWDVSDDGLVYTFHLRQGVKFHNGEELEADDVLYTIDRMGNPERLAKNSDCMTMIKGFEDMLDGKIDTIENVGLKIIDKYTVEMTLTESYAPFLTNLCVPGFSIYNREAGDAADEAGGGISGSKFGAEAKYTIGTGPFMMKDWQLNDHIYLETFPDYWKGAASVDGLLFTMIPDNETRKMMFESGQLDLLDLDDAREQIPYYKSSEEWKDNVILGHRVGTYYLSINERLEPFQDVRVRKALQMAIDRQAILDTMYAGAGVVANGIFAPGMVGYNPDLPEIPYDPEGAKALLKEAGYEDGFKMVICQTADSPQTLSVNEIIQAQLKELGIEVTIDQMDEASWYDVRRTGDLPMYMSSWSADFNDPDNFIYTFFTPRNTVTRSFNYYNTDAMNRIEKARYMTDEDARLKEYQALEIQTIQEDAAWIPLFHLEHVWVASSRMHNYTPHWAGWGGTCYWSVTLDTADAE